MPPRVVLDCRWVGLGGTGRLTELLLRGLADLRPSTTWVLWGPPAVRDLAWDGAEVVPISVDPRAGLGQRSWREVPAADLVVFMHQTRPLRPVPSITVVLDTIPLRFARSSVERLSKQAFLRTVAMISRHVVTISEYSRRCIQRDLGVAEKDVSVIGVPVDREHAERVRRLRRETEPTDVALYVGNFLPHKNLPRLVDAFRSTRFCASGGRLLLVGGKPEQVQKLSARLRDHERGQIDVRPRCSAEELDRLFAGSLYLVQPSLEEGFGLPAWEALACGLPVCASNGGALGEVLAGLVESFPAESTSAMAEALDACAQHAKAARANGGLAPPEALARIAPDLRQFAEQFEDIVARTLS